MKPTYSFETFTRIYNDQHGYYWEIRPDCDGTGLVEIRYVENVSSKKEDVVSILLPPFIAEKILKPEFLPKSEEIEGEY